MKAWDGHAMRGKFEHLGALPRGVCDLTNSADRFLGQLCADRSQPANGEQARAASRLLAVVSEAVARLSCPRFADFAIEWQGEKFANAEAGDNQDGERGGPQSVFRLHGMLAIDIRETV
jgi:hypothetical protein